MKQSQSIRLSWTKERREGLTDKLKRKGSGQELKSWYYLRLILIKSCWILRMWSSLLMRFCTRNSLTMTKIPNLICKYKMLSKEESNRSKTKKTYCNKKMILSKRWWTWKTKNKNLSKKKKKTSKAWSQKRKLSQSKYLNLRLKERIWLIKLNKSNIKLTDLLSFVKKSKRQIKRHCMIHLHVQTVLRFQDWRKQEKKNKCWLKDLMMNLLLKILSIRNWWMEEKSGRSIELLKKSKPERELMSWWSLKLRSIRSYWTSKMLSNQSMKSSTRSSTIMILTKNSKKASKQPKIVNLNKNKMKRTSCNKKTTP